MEDGLAARAFFFLAEPVAFLGLALAASSACFSAKKVSKSRAIISSWSSGSDG